MIAARPDFPILPDLARRALVDLGYSDAEADHGLEAWYDNASTEDRGLVTELAFEVMRTFLNFNRENVGELALPGWNDDPFDLDDYDEELPDPRAPRERGEMVLEAYAGKGWRADSGTLARLLTDLAAVAETLGPDAFAHAYLTAYERTNP